MITMQVESEKVLSCVFHGAIWSFRDAMDAHGIPGLRDENNVYYRVVQSVDVSSEQGKERLLRVFAIFHDLVNGSGKRLNEVHATEKMTAWESV